MNAIFKSLKLRENTLDEYICNEIIPSYGHIDYKDKIVMDIGGCFGAFSYYALYKKAYFVYSYEPVQENYDLLTHNINKYPNVECKMAALVPHKGRETFFYPGRGTNKGIGSFVKYRGREETTVTALNFEEELYKIKPDVIKMDIEGGEYELIKGPLPKFVKEVVMEIHLNRKIWRNKEAQRLISYFKDWDIVKAPRITEANWHTIGSWKRRKKQKIKNLWE